MEKSFLSRVGALVGACALVGVLTTACHEVNPPHIMVVMMENQGYSQIIGNPALPYVNSLATHYAVATQSFACSHGSLTDYIDIVSGVCPAAATTDPAPAQQTWTYQTVADQLQAAGDTVKAYAENLPADPATSAGPYVVQHDPWPYFPDTHVAVAGAATMTADLNSADPADFLWYTPNIFNDGHTGQPTDTETTELAGTESFLSTFIPSVQSTAWYRNGGQIVIEWDEALPSDTSGIDGASGGHVLTLVVSNFTAANPTAYLGAVTTAGILHSIEHIYSLPYLGDAAVTANGNIDPLLYW